MNDEKKMELPAGWKKINFYSLNLAYCFVVMFAGLQFPPGIKIITKYFGQEVYDMLNAWAFILLIVTGACSGILGYVRINKAKKILTILESDDSTTTNRGNQQN